MFLVKIRNGDNIMHKIDLKKYEIRTDMALDLLEKSADNFKIDNYEKDGVKVSWLKLDEDNILNKKKGTYLTLEFDDVTDDDSKKIVSNIFKEELDKMLKKEGFNKNTKTIVIGLGNRKSTPDALGPFVSEKIIVTKHFFDMNVDVEDNFTSVASFYPGVTGTTGIETGDLIKGVINEAQPDMVIVVDALSSTSISRVNKSIQVTNSGISPGSGIGNKRKEISKETLGIPVIAIGIPTVLSAAVIVRDTINYMVKNYAYNKSFKDKKASKLVTKQINYINKKVEISKEDKRTLLGLVGLLSEEELTNLIYEVLTPIGYDLMVTPKEIDFLIEKLSDVISYGINHTLHFL